MIIADIACGIVGFCIAVFLFLIRYIAKLVISDRNEFNTEAEKIRNIIKTEIANTHNSKIGLMDTGRFDYFSALIVFWKREKFRRVLSEFKEEVRIKKFYLPSGHRRVKTPNKIKSLAEQLIVFTERR